MKYLRTPSGELVVDGADARMRKLLTEIDRTNDQKLLKLLNKAWWREWFRSESQTLKRAA